MPRFPRSLTISLMLAVAMAAGISSAQAADTWTQVAGGEDHTCAVTTEGGVRCWGDNSLGQLGSGNVNSSYVPVNVVGLSSGVAQVATGNGHSCALTTAGGVKCWGQNSYGELGDGTDTNRLSPVDVSGLTSGVASIVTGAKHTCAVTTLGGAKCWGLNSYGQLGDGSTTTRKSPVDVSGLTTSVSRLAAGLEHTCAVLTDASAKCWGNDFFGQLGNASSGGFGPNSAPVTVLNLTNGADTPGAGGQASCAITSGALTCWGRNNYGQLGVGSNVDKSVPTGVNNLSSGVAQVAGGAYQTCARMAAGSALCWGLNDKGQLGNGTNTNANVPVVVTGMGSGVAQVGAGASHTCAVSTAGALKCWGLNSSGQLGTGNRTDSNTPVSVVSRSAAPTGVQVTPGDRSLAVEWAAPSDTGSFPIIIYTATASGNAGSCQATAPAVSCTIGPTSNAGLVNGTEYTVTVAAYTLAGTGAASSPVASGTPGRAPDAPTTVVASTPTATSTSVTFTEPFNTSGRAVTGFTASCTSQDGGTARAASGASSPIEVAGLTPGATYTCTVLSTNAMGDSPASQASSAITVPLPPDPPAPAADSSQAPAVVASAQEAAPVAQLAVAPTLLVRQIGEAATGPVVRRRSGPAVRTTFRLRFLQPGRYSLYIESPSGGRQQLLTGSRVGRRALPTPFVVPVIPDAKVGTARVVTVVTRAPLAAGSVLRVVRQADDGSLAGQLVPTAQ